MRRTNLRILVLTACALLACGSFAQAQLVLADAESNVAPVILTPDDAGDELNAAIVDLRRALSTMTGLRIDVSHDASAAGQPFVAVGNHPVAIKYVDFEQLENADRETYVIRTADGGLVLTGATEAATSIAIYHWLHEMGCRWFFPGDVWETVPGRPRIELADINLHDQPRLNQRRFWYGWGLATTQNKIDYANWVRRNRLSGRVSGHPGHAYQAIADPDTWFEDHPEWFPLIDGKRSRKGQLCLSNEQLQQHAVQWAERRATNEPDTIMISASPNDGGSYCQCEPCAEMGSRADQTLHLANMMAEAISKIRPHCFVGMYAYYANCMPPSIEAHPNVVIYVANGYISGGYTFEELLEGWSKKANHLAVREYFDVMIWSRDRPQWKVDRFANAFALYGQYNVTGVSGEASNNWGPQGLNYYVITRLMWDPQADVDEVIDDFIEKCWGPAAPAMRTYYDMWQFVPVRDWSISMAYAHLERAIKLAGDDKTLIARIDLMRAYVHWLWLYTQHTPKQPPEQKVATARRAMHFSWRLANTNMVHTYGHFREGRMWSTPGVVPERIEMWKRTDQPVEEFIAPKSAEHMIELEDEDPLQQVTLEGPKEPLKPIELQLTFEHKFVSALVADDMKQLPDLTTLQLRDYSNELVPLVQPGVKANPGNQQFVFPRGNNQLYVLAEEPRSITVKIDQTGAPKKTKPHNWRLVDVEARSVIATGSIDPADSSELTLELPHAGVFGLRYGSLAPQSISIDAPIVSALAGSQSALSLVEGNYRWHYFLPEGTKRFLIEGQSKSKDPPKASVVIRAADGSAMPAKHVEDAAHDLWTVDVPADRSGEAWSIELELGGDYLLRFYGLPPFVAQSPDALLVPSETLGQ